MFPEASYGIGHAIEFIRFTVIFVSKISNRRRGSANLLVKISIYRRSNVTERQLLITGIYEESVIVATFSLISDTEYLSDIQKVSLCRISRWFSTTLK